MLLAGCQLRMARAAARLTREELARGAGVSVKTIKRLEADDGPLATRTAGTLESIAAFFRGKGVSFVADAQDGRGPGIRYDYTVSLPPPET